MSNPPVDAVIFDCDGLLLDTESLWNQIEADWCRANGVAYDESVKASVIGTTPIRTAEIFAELAGRDGQAPQVLEELDAMEDVLLGDGVTAMPGARAFVDFVAARVPFAIATNGLTAGTHRNLTSAGMGDLVERVVAIDQVEHGKPAPDLYLEAARRGGVEPGRCAALEDSAIGLRAVRAAGMFAVAVPTLAGEYDCDLRAASLEDPALIEWAEGLGRG